MTLSAEGGKALTPASVSKMLDGCGARPTVLVVSACFSGVFMTPQIAAANRIVLTASDPQNPSFGCSNDLTYNYYDGCFLSAWHASATWQDLAESVRSCVEAKESAFAGRFPPSNPQAFFGREMRDLRLPKADSTSSLAANAVR